MEPSIILYLPVWLLGVASFIAVKRINWSNYIYCFLYLTSTISIVLVILTQAEINGYFQHIFTMKFYDILLEPAEKFASDYFLAIAVVTHILASSKVFAQRSLFNEASTKVIRYLSEHTFSLYLYHMPIMYFIYAVAPIKDSHILIVFSYCVMTPLIVLLISILTENKKQSYKVFFSLLLSKKITKN